MVCAMATRPIPQERVMQDHYVDPTRTQFDAFKALPRNAPVAMLNLIRFRERAAYPADHPYAREALSGAEAYARYGRESAAAFARAGGTILFAGRYECMVIGPDDKHWHRIFIARYPTAAAFLGMLADPEYRAAVVNRTAAVDTSRLMRLAPEPGEAHRFA
jgi:uncharacterized protein (DUF1330 family)